MSSPHSAGRTGLLLAWIALLALPFLAPNEHVLFLGIQFLINLILLASLNTLMGWAGQISLCHAGFFGLGAYASGIASTKAGVSPWLGLALAAMVAGLIAAAVGRPALRLKGHTLAMATLGLNSILSVLFTQLVPLTGGPNGLLGVPPLSLPDDVLTTAWSTFLAAWIATGIVLLALLNLIQSRLGRALGAIAFNETAAAAAGIDASQLKLQVFVLTAGMAGLAGGLYVHANQYVSPETSGTSVSVLLVAMVAIGGWGRYWGAVPAALVMTLSPEFLQEAQDAELLLFGVLMISVLLFFPGGLVAVPGAISRVCARLLPNA
ncbi:MAG: branched-chain amino acid ABC transporter permease [Rhodopila sp.]|nr:branched-chain amino acid ABC transporter permease [Rhodopila sp.]